MDTPHAPHTPPPDAPPTRQEGITHMLPRSLRARLIMLVLIAILPAMLLTVYYAVQERQQRKAEAKEDALILAQRISLQQDHHIESSRQFLTTLAHIPEVREGETPECGRVLAALFTEFPQYTGGGTIDRNGDPICSSSGNVSANFADAPWFERTLETRSFTIGEYEASGRVTGRPLVILSYPMLEVQEGDTDEPVESMVIAGLSLEWFNTQLDAMELETEVVIHIVDRDGNILARHPDAGAWLGQPLPSPDVLALLQAEQQGVTEAAYQPAAPPAADTTAPPEAGEEGIYQPGQQQVFGFAPLSTTIAGTRVVVSQPTDVVFAAANQALLLNLGLLLLVTLLAIGAARYGSDILILNRLRVLLATMQRVGRGDLAARVEHGSNDEVGRLEAEFNTTAATLEQQVAALQQSSRHNQQLQEQERERTQMLEQVVEHYLAFVRQVGAGNLEQRLQETAIEESSLPQHTTLNNLARELNTMVERQQHIIGQIREASTSISSAAAQILTATAEQSSSSTEQSAAITQASSTVAEVKAIAQQSSQQATLVAQESQAMLVMTRQGTQAVEETVRGMGQIRERVQSIAQTILELSERTQAIEVITKTVSELADQSNMLALNAAIEAARAGEQGRSFAVVAQHVRDLAERSKKATGEVQNILAEIQSAANNAVMVTEEGHKGVELGTEQASKAGQAIHRIAEEVENSVQTNVQMASAAQQAMTGMGQIGQAMNAIQQASQQTLASTRQAEQAARALHTLAQKLQQTIEMHQ